jgi:putative ABC transport system permease protein
MGLHSIMNGAEFTWYSSNAVTAAELKDKYSEVENAVRIQNVGRTPVKYKNQQFDERNGAYVDASMFKIFTYPFISGDPETALEAPFTVVLAKSVADKYFGDEDPIGKVLTFRDNDAYTVTGVMDDPLLTTDINYDMFCSMETLYAINGRDFPQYVQWLSFNFWTLVLLHEGVDYKSLEAKFPEMIERNCGDQLKQAGATMEFFMQPFTDVHLRSLNRSGRPGGALMYIYLFSVVAFFILLIACINFMNLSSARSINRAREVGMRKVFGAAKTRLIKQFLSESILYSIVSLALALIIVEAALPYISFLSGQQLDIEYTQSVWIIPGLILFAIVIGVFAGSYPAFFLSSFKPVNVLKSGFKSGKSNSRFRNILVIFQFSISIILVTGTWLIANQIDYMKSKDAGFNKEQVVVINITSDHIRNSLDTIKEKFLSHTDIMYVSAASSIPGWGTQFNQCLPEGFSADQMQLSDELQVDDDFLPVLGIELIAGRNFSPEFPTDDTESVIINETSARKYGWNDPLGKTIKYWGADADFMTPKTIIGVVKDFHIRPVLQEIESISLMNDLKHRFNRLSTILVRIKPGSTEDAVAFMQAQWNEIDPGKPFNFRFLDTLFDNQFRNVERSKDIFSNFTIIAIIIACLGLLGLASFTAEQRTKEIGIRKTLGASTPGIVIRLCRELVKFIVIANVIAWPVTYFALNRWLQQFPYRGSISFSTFVWSTILVVVVGLVTVSYQAVKAAGTNPVDALKYE